MEIIGDKEELELVYRKLVNSITLPKVGVYSIANLLKIKPDSGCFYIIQTLLDSGYYYSGKTLRDEYRYQVIGMAKLRENFGSILLRPEEKTDRIVGRFFKSDIKIPNAAKFNEKYYVAADRPDMALKVLSQSTTTAIAKLTDLQLQVKKGLILVYFERTQA